MGIAPPENSHVKCNKITHDSEKNNPTPAKDISLTRSDSSNIVVLPRRKHISTVIWHLDFEVYDVFSRQTWHDFGAR